MRPSSLDWTLIPSSRQYVEGNDVATQVLVERSTRAPWRQRIPQRPDARRQAPATREHALAEASGREILLRRNLSLAVRRAERTYELAVRQVDEFDLYLDDVHRRLRGEGYLCTDGRRDKVPLRG
jgi:hypothetical protein